MNKPGVLFNLKEWLTIPDAARHLSTIFDESVTEADILRLGLDGHLTISVYFVNHTDAKHMNIVPIEDVYSEVLCDSLEEFANDHFWENGRRLKSPLLIGDFHSSVWEKGKPDYLDTKSPNFQKYKNSPVRMPMGVNWGGGQWLNYSSGDVETISGIWDLAMAGAELLDLEQEWQQLTGGPDVTLPTLDGTFVRTLDGEIYQLQESMDQNENVSGSLAQLEKLKKYIEANNFKKDEADKLIAKHAEERKLYIDEKNARPYSADYYPAGGLPEDSVLVVRTEALMELQNQIAGPKNCSTNDLSPRTEKAYLNAIGALLSCLTGDFKETTFSSEAELRKFIDKKYDGYYGLKSRTLAEKFAAAKKSINEAE
ncbi:MAG: hypothetical protein PHG14_14620 [Desulfobacter postgatei]|uniref:hypothetical protein n=1 Tax=Desulfobacter postgatei TaxID=2293 RepID=UPI0023F0A0EA|nr:hypothetical protein [Desulfobacter postgatei]MDD4274947.1 hypothetical protein [Desulfobacter postgatei]